MLRGEQFSIIGSVPEWSVPRERESPMKSTASVYDFLTSITSRCRLPSATGWGIALLCALTVSAPYIDFPASYDAALIAGPIPAIYDPSSG